MEIVFAPILLVGSVLIWLLDNSEEKWYAELTALAASTLCALFLVKDSKFFEQIILGTALFILLYIAAIMKRGTTAKYWANLFVCLGASSLFLESNQWISKPDLFLAKVILFAVMAILPAFILVRAPRPTMQYERMMGMFSLFHLFLRIGLIYLATRQSYVLISDEAKLYLQISAISLALLLLLLALRRKAQHWWSHSQALLTLFILSSCLWADSRQTLILYVLTIGSMVTDGAFVTGRVQHGLERSILKNISSLGLGSGALALIVALESAQRKMSGDILSLSWMLVFILFAALSWMKQRVEPERLGWSKKDILLVFVQIIMWVAGIAAVSGSWGAI